MELVRIIKRIQGIVSRIIVGEPVVEAGELNVMFQPQPGIEQGNDRGVRDDGIFLTQVIGLPHHKAGIAEMGTGTDGCVEEIAAAPVESRSQKGGQGGLVFIIHRIDIRRVCQTAIVPRSDLIAHQYKEILIALVLRLIPGMQPDIAVIGVRIAKSAYGIDQAEFKPDIPVGTDILRMYHADELLRLGTQEITQLGKRPGGIVQLRLLYFEKVQIIGMQTRIPPREHTGGEEQIAGRRSIVAQIDPQGRLRHLSGKIIDRRIQLEITGAVEVPVIQRDRVRLTMRKRISTTSPSSSSPAPKIAEPAEWVLRMKSHTEE